MSTQAVATVDATEQKVQLSVGGKLAALVPQDAEQAYRMAKMIAVSGIAPQGMNTPEKIVTAIFHGLEVGLKPLQAVQSIAIINGRPAIWGDAAFGLVQGSGLVEDFQETIEGEGDAMKAVCSVKRVGIAHPIVRAFSVADARTAGLWSKTGPWKQYPKRMLQMRARSWALRDGFADVLKGLQIGEEVRDYHAVTGAMTDVTPVTATALIAQAQQEGGPDATQEQAEDATATIEGDATVAASQDGGHATADAQPKRKGLTPQQMIDTVSAAPSIEALDAFTASHANAINWLRDNKPEAHGQLMAAIGSRRTELDMAGDEIPDLDASDPADAPVAG